MKLEFKIENNKYFNIKEVLKQYYCISERLLVKLKKNKKISLNGLPVYVTRPVKIDDIISIDLDFEEESKNIVPSKIDFEIIYEDDAFLIINKPPNLPVHPSISHFQDSLSNGVKYYFNSINLNRKIRPINRLDKDTSGIVIFAKTNMYKKL